MNAQVRSALAKADAVRMQRTRDKSEIYSGHLPVAEAIAEPHWATASVHHVLTLQYRWGSLTADKLIDRIPMGHGRLCGEITQRQRDCIADLLAGGD